MFTSGDETQVDYGADNSSSASYCRSAGEAATSEEEIDFDGFSLEIEALYDKTVGSLCYEDFLHLRKVERRSRLISAVGLLTAWIIPNPLSAVLIAFGKSTRWFLAHHILHKGYDRVPGVPQSYTSAHFAKGSRRYLDWFDWLHPEAWCHEHNYLHHYHTGEEADPDLVERYLQYFRNLRLPKFLKCIAVLIVGMTWKFTYYAPNTISVIDPKSNRSLRHSQIRYVTFGHILDFRRAHVRKLWGSCYLPYAAWNFMIVPFLFFPLGATAVSYVLVNMLLAEALTNLHTFLVIGPNHAGDDVYRFDSHYDGKKEFYAAQVLSSVNYFPGNDFTDHCLGWLNYQVEHHLFPNLPANKYRELQPAVRKLCEKYGLRYLEESVFRRFKKMVSIHIGATSMLKVQSIASIRVNR